MATFDTLTKAIRLLIGRRYTSAVLADSQEAFTSTIQMGSDEVWSQTNLIPSSSLPYSSSTAGTVISSSVLKYWYKWPLTVANDAGTSSYASGSVFYFMNPTGSNAGVTSQLIQNGQQTNFISPKYSIPGIANNDADATSNGTIPGYNIALFSSPDGTTFTRVTPGSYPYQFDYKTGVLEFTTAAIPPARVYGTVYQYIGQMVSDSSGGGSSLQTGSTYPITASYALYAVNGTSGSGTTLYTGSTYPITSSWAVTSTSSSFASRVDGTYVGATTGSFTTLFINTSGSISIPLSSSDAGTEGEVRVGPNFLYLYTNSRWIRSPFSQFP